MKTIVIQSFLIFFLSVSAYAQILPPVSQPEKTQAGSGQDDKFAKELEASGKRGNYMHSWAAYNQHLYTYTNKRWMDTDDQGDYIASHAVTVGFEMLFSDFSDYDSVLGDMRAGINLNSYYHGKLPSRTLEAVASLSLPVETFPDPDKPFDREWKFWLYPGVFLGVDKKWYAVDLGLTLEVLGYNESVRKAMTDAGPADIEGRGLLYGDLGFHMNFYFRLGREDKGYFDMAFYRLDYNPEYGTLLYRIVLPVSQYFTMKVGGYLYSTSVVFLEPTLLMPGMELAFRIGTVVNYNDDHLKKIAINESLIYNISFMYKW